MYRGRCHSKSSKSQGVQSEYFNLPGHAVRLSFNVHCTDLQGAMLLRNFKVPGDSIRIFQSARACHEALFQCTRGTAIKNLNVPKDSIRMFQSTRAVDPINLPMYVERM